MPKYNYGGQAVIEGVMMRGRHTAAVVLHRASGGMLVHEEQLNAQLYGSISQWPFVRGLLLLFDMLVLGTRMMRFATNVYIHDESHTPDPGGSARTDAAQTPVVEATPAQMSGVGGLGLTITLVISLAM